MASGKAFWRRSLLAILVLGSAATPSAAQAVFCGVAGKSPQEIAANVATTKGFKKHGSDARYVAYSNEAAMVTLTVTTPANEAHPAVACRRAIQRNGEWRVATTARCGASGTACKAMMREFKALDAQLKQALERSQSEP